MAAIKTLFTLILVAVTQLKEQLVAHGNNTDPWSFYQWKPLNSKNNRGSSYRCIRGRSSNFMEQNSCLIKKGGKEGKKISLCVLNRVTEVTSVRLTLILVLNQVSSGLPESILVSGRRAQATPPPVFIFNQASSVPRAAGCELATAWRCHNELNNDSGHNKKNKKPNNNKKPSALTVVCRVFHIQKQLQVQHVTWSWAEIPPTCRWCNVEAVRRETGGRL